MEFKRLTYFIGAVFSEGNRLQKTSIKGTILTKRRFTQTQYLSAFIAVVALYLLPTGFDNNFAGYTISFLGIFIGLFTGIVVSLYDKREKLLEGLKDAELTEKGRRVKIKNYMVQFTGLTAYAIVLGLIIALLLSLSLLTKKAQINIIEYSFAKFSQIGWPQIKNFIKVLMLAVHRFVTLYFLFNFFSVTIYAISSYFSFISSDYKRMQITTDEDFKIKH
jgi:hypothetical protein